jgi:hypothetical protein
MEPPSPRCHSFRRSFICRDLFQSQRAPISQFGQNAKVGLTPHEMIEIDQLQTVMQMDRHEKKNQIITLKCSAKKSIFQNKRHRILPRTVDSNVTQTLKLKRRQSDEQVSNISTGMKKKSSMICRMTQKSASHVNLPHYGRKFSDSGFGDYKDLENHRTSKYQIHPHGKVRQNWDLCLLVLIFYNTMSVPLQLAFFSTTGTVWSSYDAFVDSFFLIDVLLNFYTAAEVQGNVVFDFKTRVMLYVRTWFLVDLASSAPFYAFLGGIMGAWDTPVMELIASRPYCYLRLLRIFRVPRILNRLEFALLIRSSISSLFKFCSFTIVISHWISCIYIGIGTANHDDKENQTWSMLKSQDDTGDTWIINNGLEGRSVFDQYVASLYWSTQVSEIQ